MYHINELNEKLVNELREIAKELNIPKSEGLKKQDLINMILDYQADNPSEDTLHKEKKGPIKALRLRRKRNTIDQERNSDKRMFTPVAEKKPQPVPSIFYPQIRKRDTCGI